MPNLPAMREAADSVAQVIHLTEQLDMERNNTELLREELSESFADVELALEDQGWWQLTSRAQVEFTRAGLGRAASVARVAVQINPLLKRAVSLRTSYVWGQGVEISARDEDVNALIQDFLDDPGNQAALTSDAAHERSERLCATDGNLLFVLFTNPRTGRVQVRPMLFDEILQKINNPEDRTEPWYFLREWSTVGLLPSGSGVGAASVNQIRRAYYPALGYYPASRPKSINGIPVMWDSPVLHGKVNDLEGWQWGIGDAYPALSWARLYSEFLVDWARIAKALSKMAWRLTGDRSSKAQKAAARIQEVVGDVNQAVTGSRVGQLAASGPGLGLEAIPKSGATLDSQSGKPIAAMVASTLGVPVTMLLADPGQTGARAVAETLDRPTELEMQQRQQFHGNAVLRRILDYVIDQAVLAPQGPLRGRVQRSTSGNGLDVTLAEDVERTVDIVFPPLDEQDPAQVVTAIATADGTGKLPDEVTARLLLQALHVEDADEILARYTDEQGRYVRPTATAGRAAVDAYRRGEDPAAVLHGHDPAEPLPGVKATEQP